MWIGKEHDKSLQIMYKVFYIDKNENIRCMLLSCIIIYSGALLKLLVMTCRNL